MDLRLSRRISERCRKGATPFGLSCQISQWSSWTRRDKFS